MNQTLFPGKFLVATAHPALRVWLLPGWLALLGATAPLPAQPFAPQYALAPGWPNYVGYNLQAAARGVVAGQQQLAAPAKSAAAISFLAKDSSPGITSYLPAAPGSSGNAYNAVSTLQNRYLFGGQTNDIAFTFSQTGTFGSTPLYRNLQPTGYLSSVVNGVALATNGNAFVETAVGVVSAFIIPQAAWWENGSFQLLPTPSGGYSVANAVSGYQVTYYYNDDDEEPTNVPAYYIVGAAGTNYYSPEHAWVWTRGNYPGAGYTATDIHPDGFASSEALGVGDTYADAGGDTGKWFVGDAVPAGGSNAHALIWDEGFDPHDVHPAGFQSSSARATAFNHTVGIATTTNGLTHAMLWAGYAPVDLHGYFPGAIDSQATGIAPDGRIVGSYHNASEQLIPFVLIPQALPPLTATNIAGDTLVDTNNLLAFGLSTVQFYSASINDAGVAGFVADNSQYPATSVIFTRSPGGPPVPRLALYEPLAGGLVSDFIMYALDGASQIHALVDVDGNYDGEEVLVQTNGLTSVLTQVGDSLPDGGMIGQLNDLATSDDGRVVLDGSDANGGEFLLLRAGNATSLITHQPGGYPGNTNLSGVLSGFGVGGVSTNGDVVFTADRYVYTDPYDKYNAGRSLFLWSRGALTELLPIGGTVAPGLGLSRAEAGAINARGDIVLYGYAMNSLGAYSLGFWRRLAGQTNWETVVLEGGDSPSGVIDSLQYGSFAFNNAGAVLFYALVEGQAAHLISRPGEPLANFRPGQDANGTLDLYPGSLNAQEESVTIPTGIQTGQTDQIEFYSPRPGLANARPAGAGLTFALQAPVLDRPYAILATTNLPGPWSPLATLWPTNTLTTVSDPNAAGASQRFFQARRIP